MVNFKKNEYTIEGLVSFVMEKQKDSLNQVSRTDYVKIYDRMYEVCEERLEYRKKRCGTSDTSKLIYSELLHWDSGICKILEKLLPKLIDMAVYAAKNGKKFEALFDIDCFQEFDNVINDIESIKIET